MGLILREAIKEALLNMDGEATIGQIKTYIEGKYKGRWKDIETAVADLTYPGSKSSTYRSEERILERIERGKYRLRLQALFPKEVMLLWRRGEGGNVWGELLGVFTDVGYALEAVKGKHHLEYHFEVYPVNSIPDRGNVLFYFPHYDKDGLLR
jgi:hypothetical protein